MTKLALYALAWLIQHKPDTARNIVAWAAGEIARRSENTVSVCRKAA